jgi:DNA-binding NarL/FixJ family response regulator
MIKVLIVDDQKSIQNLLKTYLENHHSLEIVGTADHGKMAIERVKSLNPDVVLMDITMPVLDGLSATQIISEQFRETKVLILSIHDEDVYLNKALQVGAKGYLLKNTPPEELINAICSAHKNYFQLGPGLLEKYLFKLIEPQTYEVAEFDRLKSTIAQQAQRLEQLQSQILTKREVPVFDSKTKNGSNLDRQYFILEKQFHTLQYRLERLNKQIALTQSFCIVFSIILFLLVAIVFLIAPQ